MCANDFLLAHKLGTTLVSAMSLLPSSVVARAFAVAPVVLPGAIVLEGKDSVYCCLTICRR